MIDSNAWDTESESQSACKCHANEQRTGKARSLCNGYLVDLRFGDASLRQRCFNYLDNRPDVLSTRYFRYYSTKRRMHVDLRRDDVRVHHPPVFYQGGTGLVAGGFDSQSERHGSEPVSPVGMCTCSPGT
jgi:hypothetical protein